MGVIEGEKTYQLEDEPIRDTLATRLSMVFRWSGFVFPRCRSHGRGPFSDAAL